MVKPLSLLAALAATLAIATVGRGGHELPMYPSYYPHEIAIETIPPERAAPLLLENKIQAYLGPQPRFSGDVPVSIRAVESLGSFVIVLRNPASSTSHTRRSQPDDGLLEIGTERVVAAVRELLARPSQ